MAEYYFVIYIYTDLILYVSELIIGIIQREKYNLELSNDYVDLYTFFSLSQCIRYRTYYYESYSM